MGDDNHWFHRFGGHLVLLVIGLLVLLWARTGAASATLDLTWGDSGQAAETPAGPPTEGAADPDAIQAGEPISPDLIPVVDMSAVPALDESGISPDLNPITFEGKRPEHVLQTYTVQRNDTPVGIAEQFGLEAETLLGGNPRLSEEASLLQVGMELIILPVDGVLHDVGPGETLESISSLYGIPVETIIAYEPNNLEFPYRLYPGTQILVPGAVRELFVWEPPTVASSSGGGGGYNIRPAVVGTGTFVWPVSGRRITQYYWYGHRAIDIGLTEGSAIYASDTGTVVWADWNIHCYGNLIVLDHGNGYLTFYAHLSAINVVPGQVVTQGQYIGASGNTGCSSGPHIHFEIRLNGVHQDPFWPGYLP